MHWEQKNLKLSPKSRGCHLITGEIVRDFSEIEEFQIGLLHLFILHTSASLTLNENADPDVRRDMETALNHLVPDNLPFRHTAEGPDDMPAHVKASLMGASLTVPVKDGGLVLGSWQGIYLCEHRDHASSRLLVATLCGRKYKEF